MKIYSIDYSFSNKSLDVFISGCSGKPKCQNCHNPELWDFNCGSNYNKTVLDKIIKYTKDYDKIINKIIMVGGEPLDQNINELETFLYDIKNNTNKEVWLFTRYNLSEVPSNILKYCNYVKTGKYKPELGVDNNIQFGIKLATSNQIIYKIK